MKNIPELLNWQKKVEGLSDIDRIGDDIFLLEKPTPSLIPYHPFKTNMLSAVICIKGTIRGKINLTPFEAEASCMVFILPDQIFENGYTSEDFEGHVIVMSKRFLGNLEIENKFSIYLSIVKQPCVPLRESELEAMLNYYIMLQRIIRATRNMNRFEIAKYLTKALFYGIGPSLHDLSEKPMNKNEILVDSFLKLVRAHYREHRRLEFYAVKIHLTPKYMSTMIRDTSGITAGDWINKHVILEAKALLKSTNMTIQQISDDLNFSGQSDFGKYFKRIVGVSPKGYRNK